MNDLAGRKVRPPIVVEGDGNSLNLPPSPTERTHPLIGLTTSSIYSQEELNSFRARCEGPVHAVFADACFVNLANECGLKVEVDQLIQRLPGALRLAYRDTPRLADAPGFDELFLLTPYVEAGGAGRKSSVDRYSDFLGHWNADLCEFFPLSDERVRVAEAGARVTEELRVLQRECMKECHDLKREFSVENYLRFLERKSGRRPVESPSPDEEFLLLGEIAKEIAVQRRGEEIRRVLAGEIKDSERKVLTMVAGHVKFDGMLDPVEAFRLQSFCERLSSEHKKGNGDEWQVHDFSEWVERRKYAEARIQTILEADQEFRQLREKLYSNEISPEDIFPSARRLLHLVSSDRELGKGVVRYEQAKDLPVALFVDTPPGDDFTAVVIDLKGGGPFSKRMGYASLGELFQQVSAAAKEATGAHFIIRVGGSKLVLLTNRPASRIHGLALARRIEEIPRSIVSRTEHRERGALSAVDDIQRLAVFDYLREQRGSAERKTPYAYLSPEISIGPVELGPRMTFKDLLEDIEW